MLAAALALLSWRLLRKTEGSGVVQVVQDGVVLREIDLRLAVGTEAFTVEWPEGGSNRVEVQPGRIRVAEADCPDGLCVRQGWLSEGGAPLVCLPHRLVIRMKDAAELDAVAR